MDRIVYLIVLAVLANILLACSGVLAEEKDRQKYNIPNVPYNRAANNINSDDVETIDTMQTSATETNGRAARNKLFDNIFKVLLNFY